MLLGYLNACIVILFPNLQLIHSAPAPVSLQGAVTVSKAFLAGYIPEIAEQVCGFRSHLRGVRAKLCKDDQMERAAAGDVS